MFNLEQVYLQLSDSIVSGNCNLLGNCPVAVLYLVLVESIMSSPICVGEMTVCIFVHMYVWTRSTRESS
jgi:hypothetical protein